MTVWSGDILLLSTPVSYLPMGLLKIQNIVFTHNNYQNADEERYRSMVPGVADYVVFGREVGDSGTPHLQGFVRFKDAKKYSEIHKLCPGAHVEGARSPVGAIKYCKKDGDFEEYGTCPRGTSGSGRPSFGEVGKYMEQHGVRKARERYYDFFARSGHTILRNVRMPPRYRMDIECVWIYGPTGTGKSRLAHSIYPNSFRKNPRTKWWHGYEYEGSCIMDDVAKNGIDINYLLRWFDQYPCRVETKGGEMELYVRKFIVTSNYKPEQVYDIMEVGEASMNALKRRIQLVEMPERNQIIWYTN